MSDNNKEVGFSSENDLKVFLNTNYLKQIKNFFSDENKALKFMSAVIADTQRTPKLLECTKSSLINSYMMMAQMGFMPSNVSGEAYVLPYNNSKKEGDKYIKVLEAQFQMGYQGLVTLFYQAGIDKISAALVREKDKTSFVNGDLRHEVDITLSSTERGKPVGAYVIVTFRGKENVKYMNGKDIIDHAKRFSKSYDPTGKYSPWNPENDPEHWMWFKTVLKQFSKLLPKNEIINKALAEDNKDSVVEEAKKLRESTNLNMGNFLADGKNKKDEKPNKKEEKNAEDISQEINYPEDPTIER